MRGYWERFQHAEESLKTTKMNKTDAKDADPSDGCEGLRFSPQPTSYQQLHGNRRPDGATFFLFDPSTTAPPGVIQACPLTTK